MGGFNFFHQYIHCGRSFSENMPITRPQHIRWPLVSKFIAISKKSKKNTARLNASSKGVILTVVSPTYQMFYRYAVYLVLMLVD